MLGATFGTPIRSGETIVGTIDVESDCVNAFTADDAQFLEQCAQTLAPLWSTPSSVHSAVVNLSDALSLGPPPDNLAVPIFGHGTLAVEMYTLQGRDEQKPHDRDEVYLVVRGLAVFVDGEGRYRRVGAVFVRGSSLPADDLAVDRRIDKRCARQGGSVPVT